MYQNDSVVHPVKTVESTIQAIAHPIETYDYISKSISDSFVRDVINGDAESRARWMSYAFGTAVTSVVGTKGAGAVTKAGMATTKAAAKAGVSTVKGALKETSIPNLFPYAPQHQLAGVNVGGVPFNTVDSVGLRDKLLSVAKVETKGTKSTGKGIDIELKYKENWTPSQRAEADVKVKALTEAKTVKTIPNRGGTSASSRYKKVKGVDSVPKGKDVDHTIDLQLGGADDILNMNPLDKSVNRSLGKQIQHKTKEYPHGTIFDKFKIRD
ncbi:hypothetical protein [Rummeliibacillus pycnus]|uniref:hypothetical protein n=1 Tax=Rummeliibacillus pycnus TaxID=101070 RepID=UPI0037CBA451